ncbi:cyclin-dependent kinase 14 [Caerostris extrusa]|uniref:Cyclin-dependent kinase 14 n=1 Tax=Caerostris extrusa TaxID=172846 RepID=A0AAV4QGM6_CAEEX|nr:cyclin-dependent kinase 14 [Caerostris extrusa]
MLNKRKNTFLTCPGISHLVNHFHSNQTLSVGGLRSPMKRQWSAGESNLSREFSKTSDLDVRPRLPPRPKSEFFNVGDPNKYAKNSTSTYEQSGNALTYIEIDTATNIFDEMYSED